MISQKLDAKATEPTNKRGGARKGAGRKAPNGETVVMRVPERYVTAVKALIEHMGGQRKLPSHESKVRVRDLDLRLITLQIQTQLTSLESKGR
jgi:hypothetical protein